MTKEFNPIDEEVRVDPSGVVEGDHISIVPGEVHKVGDTTIICGEPYELTDYGLRSTEAPQLSIDKHIAQMKRVKLGHWRSYHRNKMRMAKDRSKTPYTNRRNRSK